MIRRACKRARLCRDDDRIPVAEHPALRLMQTTERRLDHLLELVARMRYETDAEPSGNWSRDLLSGSYEEDATS